MPSKRTAKPRAPKARASKQSEAPKRADGHLVQVPGGHQCKRCGVVIHTSHRPVVAEATLLAHIEQHGA